MVADAHDSPTAPGDVVGFSLRVTNASDSPVTISPTTTNLAGATRCRWVRIEPGATKTDCTGILSRTITSADAATGAFTPRLSYQVHSVLGDYSSAPSAVLDVTGTPVAAQGPDEIVVEIDGPAGSTPADIGDVLRYSLRVTNRSGAAVTVSPSGSNLAGSTRCRWLRIEAGATKTDCTGILTRTVDIADAVTGSFTPTVTYQVHAALEDYGSAARQVVTATGSPAPVTPIPSQSDRLGLVIEGPLQDTTQPLQAGDRLSYSVRPTNRSATAFAISALGSNLEGTDVCRWRSIAPGETKSDCTHLVHRTLTQADIDAQTFTPWVAYQIHDGPSYTAPVVGQLRVDGGETDITVAPLRAALPTRVSATQDRYEPGDVLRFVHTVTNVSASPVTHVVTGGNLTHVTCGNIVVGAGATIDCVTRRVLTTADLAAASFAPTTTSEARAAGRTLQALTVEADPWYLPSAQTANPGTEHDASWSSTAGWSTQQLAQNGQAGFGNYRIVALATDNDGGVHVSYDGRPWGGDSPNPNSILARTSLDGGQAFGPQQVIAAGRTAAPRYGFSDPSYVVDRETGTLFNFFVESYDAGWSTSQPGTAEGQRDVMHAAVAFSVDNGATWQRRTITGEITPDPSWRSRFATSGAGIQIQHGPYAGRLVQQYVVVIGSGSPKAVSVFSDDHGQTWQAGTPVGTNMDENKVVELSDGRLMLNSRDHAGGGYRKVAHSGDGGQTWSTPVRDTELIDPTNNASIIRAFPTAAPGSAEARVLLFSNTATQSGRHTGTIKVSYDDGETWPVSKVFEPGAVAYTSLATLADGRIGMAYENGSGIFVAAFSLSWLGATLP